MNTNPYTTEDLEKILSRVTNSNIPKLLEVILLSREFENLLDDDKRRLSSNICSINKLDPNYDISARNKIISALKVKVKNEDRQLARAVFQNRINELEQSKEPILDFDRLIKKLNLTKDEILKNYFSKEYFCYMTGFIAGMPFLGNLNEKIRCERLETPRVKVPKGSIGITEEFTNIYTFESPGGWNIIGNTPKKIFKKKNLQEPALIKPGHRIIFYQISKKEYLKYND